MSAQPLTVADAARIIERLAVWVVALSAEVETVRQGRVKRLEQTREAGRRYRERHTDRERARWKDSYARRKHSPEEKARKYLRGCVARGRVVKPTICSACHQAFPKNQIQAHHEDYGRPLDVTWLCSRCHGRLRRHRVRGVA